MQYFIVYYFGSRQLLLYKLQQHQKYEYIHVHAELCTSHTGTIIYISPAPHP